MSVFNPNKTVSSSVLPCGGRTTVTLSFSAAPELNAQPADIVLVMDSSGSMAGSNLAAAKVAAKQLIATVAKASGSTDGSEILNGSRLGLVSFADTAVAKHELSGDVATLETVLNSINAGGFTNHKAAFETAARMLAPSTAARRILIMFTDGLTTVGGDPLLATQEIKDSGIEIYCIGLTVDDSLLNPWASVPSDRHLAYARSDADLEAAFAQIASEVVLAGAQDVVIHETLNPDFHIVHLDVPNYSTVNVLNPQTLEWRIDAVGSAGPETASLSFEIIHNGTSSGVKQVNQSIHYTDRAGNELVFPDPTVTIACDDPIVVEPCPVPTEFQLDSCQDAAVVCANDTYISGLGRIVQVDAVIKNVCPCKRVAVAVFLTELDTEGMEHPRGIKTVLIPAQSHIGCRDVELKCISFVLPEALDVSGNQASLCNTRKFQVRVLANYVDTDFVCCDARSTSL